MIRKKNYIGPMVIFMACIFFENPAFPKAIEINENLSKKSIDTSIEFLVDPRGTLDIKDILNPSIKREWKTCKRKKPGFGFTNDAYWVTFSFKNTSEKTINFFLQQEYPQIDFIELNIILNNLEVKKIETGDHFPFSIRPVRYRNFIFPMSIKSHEEEKIYLRYKTTGSMNIHLEVLSEKKFDELKEEESIFFWITYGIFLAMFLYNLIIFLSTRDLDYLYYILMIASLSLFLMSMDGLAFQYLFPENIWLGNYSIPISTGLSIITIILFAQSFIETRKNNLLLHRILTFLLIISTGLLIITFFVSNYFFSTKSLTILGGISAPICTIIVIYIFIKKKSKQAAFFLVSFFIFFSGALIMALGHLGIISSTFFVTNGMKLGIVLQIIMLSFGLADKINIMKSNLLLSQNELHKLNKQLESKVEMRTEELEKTNILLVESTTEIAQANEKLETAMEELKKINNELIKKTDELDIAKKEAEKANYQKSKFLTNMSHELRTPLNSIHGIVELLQFGSYEKDHFIITEIKKTLQLIENSRQKFSNYERLNIITEELKVLEKGISEDGNMRKYLISEIEKEIENNKFEEFNEQLSKNIFKIKELIISEEKDIFNAYKRIKLSGNYLLGLIDQVLNLSKIESGNMDLNKSEIFIHDFIEDIINDARSYQKSKGKEDLIEIDFLIENSAPLNINADRQKLKQILLNLISNAIKFTDKGKVSLFVKKQDMNLKFTIIDTGKGIQNEEIENLFKEFERTKDSFGVEGTGLGLAISKKLIELHGGTMGLESEYGKGSTFWFELPI